jgi:hypothetical protein
MLVLVGASVAAVASESSTIELLGFPSLAIALLLFAYVCREPSVRSARITIATLASAYPDDPIWLTWMYSPNKKVLRSVAEDPAFAVRMTHCRSKSFVVMREHSLDLWSRRGTSLEKFAVIPIGTAKIVTDPRELPSNAVTLAITSKGTLAGRLVITPSDGSFWPRWPMKEKAYRTISKWAS